MRASNKQQANRYRWNAYITVFLLICCITSSMIIGFFAATERPMTLLTLIWAIHHAAALVILVCISTTSAEMHLRLHRRRNAFGSIGPIETFIARLATKSGLVMHVSSYVVVILYLAQCTNQHASLGIMWLILSAVVVFGLTVMSCEH